MSGASIESRVVRASVLVAALSSLLLAAAAGLNARLLLQARERQALVEAADALAGAIQREAEEERLSLDAAVPEAFRESTLPNYRAEVWDGSRLVAANWRGQPLGPGVHPGWVLRFRPLPGGRLLLVATPEEHGRRALGVFAWSLALAAPLSLAAALLIGRIVGRWAARPLLDFRARVRSLRGLEPLPPPAVRDVPREVEDVEAAFREVWARLDETVRHELEFAANASHELRLPLARIRLQAERALSDCGPLARGRLAAQVEELDRLVRVIDALLVLSRDVAVGVPGGEVVNVADVCRRVAGRVLDGSCESECAFPDEALVRGDENLIEIAVENLLDNARKFSVSRAPVQAILTEQADRVALLVTTPGGRIPPADRQRLFHRFHRSPQARARRDGHGLGLALARHIARLHAGEVSCVSGPEEDVRFALELPAWTAARPTTTGASSSSAASPPPPSR